MNCLALVLCLATGALAFNPLLRSVRSVEPSCPCTDPCDDCDQPPACNKTYTPFCDQDIYQELVLTCTPDSYFRTISFKDTLEDWPTGCTGIKTLEFEDVDGIYEGITWSGKKETLNACTYRVQLAWLNGNKNTAEYAELDDCKCKKNILRSSQTWIVVNGPESKVPAIDACCTGGAQHLVAVDYELEIYGEGCHENCCSKCSLHRGIIDYPKPVTN